jgi:hypothetical protein
MGRMKTIILSLILLGITEALLKPVMTRLTQMGIKAYIMPAYERLDELLTIPDNWQRFIKDAESFLYDAVIPEALDDDTAEKLASYMISHFDLDIFLLKAEISKHVNQLELKL